GARQNASKDTEETKKFSQVFEMDEVVIRASADDDIFDDHEAVDLRSTFDEASAYFQAEDYTNAITLYRRVLNASDETNWQKAASYNIALAYEHQHRWTDAQEAFEEVIRHFPTTEEGRDAHFRLAEVLAQIGEFQRIVPLMDR